MSESAFDALESEAFDSAEIGLESEGGESFEGEAYGDASAEGWGEDARSDARRRAMQQRIMLARRQAQRQQAQRQAQLRRLPPPSPTLRPTVTAPSQQQAMTAVRSLDLDTRVSLDSLRRQIDEANRRAAQATYSALGTLAVSQGLDTWEKNLEDHPFVRAAARWAPLAILPADKKRRGATQILLHPAFIGGAVVGGILLIGRFTSADQRIFDIKIANPSPLTVGDTGTLSGVVVDRSGRVVAGVTPTWQSADPQKLTVDAQSGSYTAGPNTGQVTVTATAVDVSVPISVTVVPASSDTKPTTAPQVFQIKIAVPGSVSVGAHGNLTGTAVDQIGREVPADITWTSSKRKILTVKPTGAYDAKGPGTVIVTATAGDVKVPTSVTVTP